MGDNLAYKDEYDNLIRMLDECNIVRYTAYRTAAKLRILQKALKVEKLTLDVIANVFTKHCLRATENEVFLELPDLETLVSDIYLATRTENTNNTDASLSSQLAIHVLQAIYQSDGCCSVQVLLLKVIFVILCSSQIQDKYQYLFHQLSDHNNCVSRKKIDLLLKATVKLTDFLSEPSYSAPKLIENSVESCFKHCQGSLGLTEDSFMEWLLCEPQILMWHSVLYRMQSAELVCHYVRCDVCKVYPITGLRYTCLHCFSYNQCQACFFTGKVSKNHKLKHPIQEYCCQITPKEAATAFLKMLRNRIHKGSSKYLTNESSESVSSDMQASSDLKNGTITRFHHSYSRAGNSVYVLDDINLSRQTFSSSRFMQQLHPQKELQNIIQNLEEQERKMEREKEKKIYNQKEFTTCLQEHQMWLNSQIYRLKILMEYISYIQSSNVRRPLACIESTPILPTQHRFCNVFTSSQPSIANLSPIVKQDSDFNNELKKINFHFSDLSEDCRQDELSNLTSVTCRPRVPNNCTYSKNTRVLDDCSVEGDLLTSSELSSWLNSPRVLSLQCAPITNCTYSVTNTGDFREETIQNVHSLHEKCKQTPSCIDEIVERLQKVLSLNFHFDDSFTCRDNTQLEKAATEIEELLATLINRIEERKKTTNAKNV
ncbi:dystrophin-related protein 2-like isoform X1 [Schistocerca americana]|uniref:dystrophin-related protein 2-like isoform X1 n=1 Tax=Schistocerca americana TaxID=7009 RepID=UPI001F4FD595|nr:dystrophin-related protein 2-like isoform X1 [Schistocerca americana]